MGTPKTVKTDEIVYSDPVIEGNFVTWTETKKCYSTVEKMAEHKANYEAIKVAELARDQDVILDKCDEEIEWASEVL